MRGANQAAEALSQLQHCLEEAFACYSEAGDVAAGAEAARRLAFNLSVTADARFDHWLGVAISTTADVHLRGQGEIALVRAVVSQARGEWEASWAAAQSAMELSERAGMHRSLVDAMAVAIEAATATGRRTVLPELIARLTTLMQGHRARLQITGLCAIAPAAMLLGDEDQAWRSLAQARSLLPSVGRNEQAMVLVAEAHTAALARRHDVAAAAYAQAEALAGELGFGLARLGYRFHRLQAEASHQFRPGLQAEVLELADELSTAGAGSYAEAARKLADNLSA